MTIDINVPVNDEDIDNIPEGLDYFNRMLEDAQHILDHPDAYNKAEVLSKLEDFVYILAESLKVAAPIMEGTYEIHQMTKDPNE
jgi:hypothetical protein